MNGAANAAALRALLQWHVEAGVDEAVGAAPADLSTFKGSTNRRAPTASPRDPGSISQPATRATPPRRESAPARAKPVARFDGDAPMPTDEAASLARRLAAAAQSVEALAAAVEAFDGCPLKQGARNTVFIDGAINADLMVIGEAPGRDEDASGKPFVGRGGQLLDRMLAAIDRRRAENALITNVVFWRPPGNRTPTQAEVAVCRPFVERLIELVRPRALLLAGGAPGQALLGLTGIMRTRGTWRTFTTESGIETPALPTLHPAFLLRQPTHKRLAWRDMQALAARLTTD